MGGRSHDPPHDGLVKHHLRPAISGNAFAGSLIRSISEPGQEPAMPPASISRWTTFGNRNSRSPALNIGRYDETAIRSARDQSMGTEPASGALKRNRYQYQNNGDRQGDG